MVTPSPTLANGRTAPASPMKPFNTGDLTRGPPVTQMREGCCRVIVVTGRLQVSVATEATERLQVSVATEATERSNPGRDCIALEKIHLKP
uniref:Uncharacterized protein n=1 Tax=Romanomermis culicivorax TaxID=13658 RepID=A0A915KZY1_ROMCU